VVVVLIAILQLEVASVLVKKPYRKFVFDAWSTICQLPVFTEALLEMKLLPVVVN
jgi:hypothetical protein